MAPPDGSPNGTDEGKRGVRRAVRGADRAFRVIPGGADGAIGGGGAGPVARDDDACPVTPLGHLAGIFHFLDVRGQKRELSARQLGSRLDLLALFGGDDSWLRARHPKRVQDKGTNETGEPVATWKTVDFKINDAAAALQSSCFAAGLFGEHVVLRRPGVWRDGDGAPAVHCGDEVLIGTDWHKAGKRTGGQIWAAAPPTPRPATPCAAGIAVELQQGLTDLWSWREAGGPVAILGLIANAYYGAATDWRPAGFVTGDTGGGKSALQRVMRAALPLHHYDNDTTKAGLEQAIDGRAMAAIIDEAADRADRDSARRLVDLVLSATGEEGTKGSRGTVDGRGRRIEVAGSIIMFSINPPELEPQHLGRFTIVDLRKPEGGADHRARHRALADFARKHAAALWGRALAAWDRYNEALALFRAGLAARGCGPREMDQAGALIAGWWVLTQEGLPDARGVREGIGALDGFVRLAADVAADDRPRRMVHHLMASLVQMHRSTDRETVGRLVEIGFGNDPEQQPHWARELLGRYGIRVIRAAEPPDHMGRPAPRLGEGDGLWFANQNPELRKLFAGTPFDGDRWRYELIRLESARKSQAPVRIGAVSTRAIWVSRSDIDPGEGAQEPDP